MSYIKKYKKYKGKYLRLKLGGSLLSENRECSASNLVTNTNTFVKNDCSSSNFGGCNIQDLTLKPGDSRDFWIRCSNPGDGHCFYWTLLRFFRAYNLYPELTSYKNNQLEAIGKIRSAVLQYSISNPEDTHVWKDSIRHMRKGLDAAEKGIGVGEDGWALELDHNMASKLFNICIIIWNEQWRPGFWTYTGGPDGYETDFSRDCHDHVLFAINSGGLHFDTLIPNSQSKDSGKKAKKAKSNSEYVMEHTGVDEDTANTVLMLLGDDKHRAINQIKQQQKILQVSDKENEGKKKNFIKNLKTTIPFISDEAALQLYDISDGDIQKAVNLYFEDQ